VFSLDLPADNILGLPGPTSTPAVAAGYFVVLRPMSVGDHTVALAGAFTTGEQFDITFNVTVLPG
jgi:hypothetical protein